MFIASQKRKENIAEYLIYMWQVEDLIRANNLDLDRITKSVIDRLPVDAVQHKQVVDWYESLIDMMRRENVESKGHLQINKNVLNDLVRLHQRLLSEPKFANYTAQFYKALPFIVELRSHAGAEPAGEIETCFNALYGTLLLRLQGKDVSQATVEAIAQISKFIGMLAAYHKLDQDDKLFENER